jgi:MFS family permease
VFSSTFRFLGGYAYTRRDLRLLFAAMFLSFLGASITFPLRLLYAQAHGATPTELGIMAAAFTAGILITQVPMGWLVDHWGRLPVLYFALFTHPVLSFLYIPLHSPVQQIVLRFLEGVTVAAFQPAISAYIADVTPTEHRSEAYGGYAATLNGGMLLGPLFGGILGQQFGFVTAFLVNVVVELAAIPLVLGQIQEPSAREQRTYGGAADWSDLFTLPLLSIYIAFLAVQVAFNVLGALWAIWVNSLGGSYTYIGVTFSLFAFPQIIFGTGAGRLADRWGRGRLLVVSGIIPGLIYISYGFLHNLVAIAALGMLEGTLIVFFQPITSAVLAEAAAPRARGRIQGLAGVFGSVGGVIASLLSVPLFHVDARIPFGGAGIVMIVGSVIGAVGIAYVARHRTPDQASADAEATA